MRLKKKVIQKAMYGIFVKESLTTCRRPGKLDIKRNGLYDKVCNLAGNIQREVYER